MAFKIIDVEEYLKTITDTVERVSFDDYQVVKKDVFGNVVLDAQGDPIIESKHSLAKQADEKVKDYLNKANLTNEASAKIYANFLQGLVTNTVASAIASATELAKTDPIAHTEAEINQWRAEEIKRSALLREQETRKMVAEAEKMAKEAGVKITEEEQEIDGVTIKKFVVTDTGGGFIDKEIDLKGRQVDVAVKELDLKTAQVALSEKEITVKEKQIAMAEQELLVKIKEVEIAEKQLVKIKYESAKELAQAHNAMAGASVESKKAGGSTQIAFDNDDNPTVQATYTNNGLLDKEILLREKQAEAIAEANQTRLEIEEARNMSNETIAYIQATGQRP